MEDEEGHNSYKKPRKIHINYNNDSQMADFLDYENDFTQTQTQAQTQTQTQTQDDDFDEPNSDDEHIYEEPNASNTQIVLGPMENQPDPVDIIHEDTKDHFQNDLTWKTKPEVLDWLEEHAMKVNCVLVKGQQGRWDRFEMICERSGTGASKVKKGTVYVGKTGRKNRTKTKKRNCPFKIVFNLKNKTMKKEDQYWIMNKDMDCRHNHPRPKDLHGHAKVARLKPDEMLEVDKMTRARLPSSRILSKLKADNKNNKSTMQTIYNARQKIRRLNLQGRMVMQQVMWLGVKNNYACQKKLDDFGQVTHLFIAHPECAQLAICFPQVIILDCTYKTNKYEMPLMNIVGHTSTKAPFTVAFCFMKNEKKESYVWGLEQLKLIFREGALPKVFVSDQDSSLMYAIKKVFPDAFNFLCTFHIWCNVMKKCQPIIQPLKLKELENIAKLPLETRVKKKNEFLKAYEHNEMLWASFHCEWEALIWSITEDVYEENFQMLIKHWKTAYPDVITYLVKDVLEPNKERFVSCFTNRHKHFDNQATSMVESAHYRLKKNLFGCVDTFVTVFDAIDEYFKSDVVRIKAAFEHDLMFRHKHYGSNWLRQLTYRVSHLCIDLLMKEVDLIKTLGANLEEECVCKMKTSMGLPCRHDLLRYKDGVIPFEDIDHFWKQLSFDPLPIEDDKDDLEIWDTTNGKNLAEMYRNMSRPQKKFLWDNMMPVMYPFTQENILEPEKSEPKGRKSKKMNNFQTRQANKELLANKRDPSSVEYHDAMYEKAKKEIEKLMKEEEVKVPKKRGRPSIQKAETSNKEADHPIMRLTIRSR